MNDKELNELLEYNQEYMDARLSEDVFGGDYTSEFELKYLQKNYDKLQSNWNSLREYCEENKYFYSGYQGEDREEDLAIMGVLDKMNELEKSDIIER